MSVPASPVSPLVPLARPQPSEHWQTLAGLWAGPGICILSMCERSHLLSISQSTLLLLFCSSVHWHWHWTGAGTGMFRNTIRIEERISGNN